MKKHQEKLLVAVLAGIIVLSGAAFAIQPAARADHFRSSTAQNSTLDAGALFGRADAA